MVRELRSFASTRKPEHQFRLSVLIVDSPAKMGTDSRVKTEGEKAEEIRVNQAQSR
jgi:hypothetical protein